MYLTGVLVSLLTAAMFFIGKNVIANDKEGRKRDVELVLRDEELNEKIHQVQNEINGKLSVIQYQQNKQSTKTDVQLAEILTTLKYLKENGL